MRSFLVDDDPEFPYSFVGESSLVNNANGVAYLCKRCDVRGLAGHCERLICWCCGLGDNLKTRVDLRIGGATPYRENAAFTQELSLGSQRSDDN